jgi:hypothetical protein
MPGGGRKLGMSIFRRSGLLLLAILALTALLATAAAVAAPRLPQGHARLVAQRKAPAATRIGLGASRAVTAAPLPKRKPATVAALPAPAPVAAAPAPKAPPSLLFNASKLSDFYLSQSAPGAVTEVPDPAGSGQTVFKLTVGDGDVYPITPTRDPRAELISPGTIENGDEFWFSSKFFLPAEFPSSVPGWLNLMQQFGYPWSGSPPWHVEVNGTHIQWTRNQTYGWDVPWQMPLAKNQWVTVMVHERFASDGFVEMWVNGQQVTFFAGGTYNPSHVAPTNRLAMATMDSSNNQAGNSIFLQSYRKAGMFPSVTTYEGPLSIGNTRTDVGG